MGILGALAFVFALLFSVMIHEFGHYITARKFNMKVTEFFLGFGKRIWSFRRGETEFGLKAIPAGGYCRISGMTIHDELTEEEKPRAFYTSTVPKRLTVLGAGSFLHIVLGFLLLFVILAGVGTTVVTNKVGEIAPCIVKTAQGLSAGPCTEGATKSPAFIAGLLANDEIIKVGNVSINRSNWFKAVNVIRKSPGIPVDLTVIRDGAQINLTVTPKTRVENGKKVGFIGVINAIGSFRQGPISATKNAGVLTKDLLVNSVTSLFSLPAKVPSLLKETFGNQKRDPNGLVGVVGVARVSAQTASDPHLRWLEKISTFLLIIASLNIFVGVFNLFPLLPMDGGHMAIALIDGFRRWRAKLKKAPAPEPFDIEKLTPFTLVVIVILVGLSLLLLAADIFNPVNINP